MKRSFIAITLILQLFLSAFAQQPAATPAASPGAQQQKIQLGPEMVPGEYALQIVVTDLLAKEKRRVASQWIDFEIVK